MNCPRCGVIVPESAEMCPTCGLDVIQVHLGKDFMTQAPPPPQAGSPPGQQHPPPAYPPGQYPPPAYPPPPQKKDSFPVGLVVLIVVLVIAIPAIFAVMWLGISGMLVDTDDERTTLNLASPKMAPRTIGEEVHWDAELDVNKITPRGTVIAYEDVGIAIKAADGSILLSSTRPLPDSPGDYDNRSSGSVKVQVWYQSVIDTGFMTETDTIKLTGLTSEYEGALVQVLLGISNSPPDPLETTSDHLG